MRKSDIIAIIIIIIIIYVLLANNNVLFSANFRDERIKYDTNNHKLIIEQNIFKYINDKYNINCTKDTSIEYNEINYNAIDLDFHSIGDLNFDGRLDSIFMLPALNQCEKGQSYYFKNLLFPRLITESNCCKLKNLFIVEDINEDGICEIGLMESVCSGRYKTLSLYTLINEEWKLVNSCIFDVNYNKYNENGYIDIETLIQKTSKNKFKMNEKTDFNRDSSEIGKDHWLYYEMKKIE